MIGGLMKDDRATANSKVPILGEIPLLGWFFRKHGSSREKTELLVFITPHVVHVDHDEGPLHHADERSRNEGDQPTPNRIARENPLLG